MADIGKPLRKIRIEPERVAPRREEPPPPPRRREKPAPKTPVPAKP